MKHNYKKYWDVKTDFPLMFGLPEKGYGSVLKESAYKCENCGDKKWKSDAEKALDQEECSMKLSASKTLHIVF